MSNNNRNQKTSQTARRKNRRRRRSGKKNDGAKLKEFWGEPQDITHDATPVKVTSEPTAVIRSLGRAPLAGHQDAADLYFAALYERSVAFASALAAANSVAEDPQSD